MCAVLSLTGIVTALLAIGALFGGSGLAGRLSEGSLAGAGLQGTATTVRVLTDPPWELLEGHADRVEIHSEQVSADQVQVRSLDLTLLDGELASSDFERLEGRLEGVTLRTADGSTIEIERVDLAGPPEAVEATIRIPAAEVERVALAAMQAQTGVSGGEASLQAPDVIVFSVFLFRVEGRIVVEPDGSLTMAVNLPGNPRVQLVPGDPLRFTSVTVVAEALVLTGQVNATGLLP